MRHYAITDGRYATLDERHAACPLYAAEFMFITLIFDAAMPDIFLRLFDDIIFAISRCQIALPCHRLLLRLLITRLRHALAFFMPLCFICRLSPC